MMRAGPFDGSPTLVAELRQSLVNGVAVLLVGSAFERPRTWMTAVVILKPNERRITSRGCFASWLHANDLKKAAHECLRRHIPHGSILVWIEADDVEVAGAGFIVLDLANALREST